MFNFQKKCRGAKSSVSFGFLWGFFGLFIIILSVIWVRILFTYIIANLELADVSAVESQDDVDSWHDEILHRLDQDQDFLSQLKARRHRNSNQSDSETERWVTQWQGNTESSLKILGLQFHSILMKTVKKIGMATSEI